MSTCFVFLMLRVPQLGSDKQEKLGLVNDLGLVLSHRSDQHNSSVHVGQIMFCSLQDSRLIVV
jgi:hypothetical protein